MVRVEVSTTVKRPVEEVFAAMSDASKTAQWLSGTVETTKTSDGPVGVGTVLCGTAAMGYSASSAGTSGKCMSHSQRCRPASAESAYDGRTPREPSTGLRPRSVRRPVSGRRTSCISSSVCRLPFISAAHSPARHSSTERAAEAWLWAVATTR